MSVPLLILYPMKDKQHTQPQLILFKFQVGGKAPKLATADNRYVLKGGNIEFQQQFYQFFQNMKIGHPNYSLKKFIPDYNGVLILEQKPKLKVDDSNISQQFANWLKYIEVRYEHRCPEKNFILMQNFIYRYHKPNVLDIKIGAAKEKQANLTHKARYNFIMSGLIKTDRKNQTQFLSKYYFYQKKQIEQITKALAYFFNFQNKLNLKQLQSALQQTRQFCLSLRTLKQWKLGSCSICYYYDSDNTDQVCVKFIDFQRVKHQELSESYNVHQCQGAENVAKMLQKIIKNIQKFEGVTVDKSEDIVPQEKMDQYEKYVQIEQQKQKQAHKHQSSNQKPKQKKQISTQNIKQK